MPAAAEHALLSRTDFQVVSMGSTFGRTAAVMSMKVGIDVVPILRNIGSIQLFLRVVSKPVTHSLTVCGGAQRHMLDFHAGAGLCLLHQTAVYRNALMPTWRS